MLSNNVHGVTEFPATVSKISNFLHKNQHILKTERMTNQQKLGIFNVQRQFLKPKMKLIPENVFSCLNIKSGEQSLLPTFLIFLLYWKYLVEMCPIFGR